MTQGGRAFERVLVLMFENQFRSYVMENDYMAGLAAQGVDMAAYFGVMHPSQTNYIASIAGELCNVTDDDRPMPPLSQRTVVDLLEEAPGELAWTAYMDGYVPESTPWIQGLVPDDAYPYVLKHNPFSSFQRILESRDRWARVVGADQLWRDLVAGTLPEYAWFTPDMWNDGHYLVGTHEESIPRAPALVDQAADWLKGFFGRLRFPGPDSLLPEGTLVVVTFDEADFEADFDEHRKYTYDGPNQVYTVLLGDCVTPGVEDGEAYNHYSLLRTVEENFDLGSLDKNDRHANWFRFLWGRRFVWGAPAATPLRVEGGLAAVGLGPELHVAHAADGGAVRHAVRDGEGWRDEGAVGIGCEGPLALVAEGDGLLLLARTDGGAVEASRYLPGSGWSAPEAVVDAPVDALAAVGFADGGSVMLAWSDDQGALWSRRRDGGGWGAVVRVGDHRTTGDLELAALGSGLYLVHQSAGGIMEVVSYNTAAFNVVTVADGPYGGSWDDTTRDAWSPSAFPVTHFTAGPAEGGEREGDLRTPYRGQAPLAAATLDGVIHLVHPRAAGAGLVTETFSLSGILTPALPVSYASSDKKTTSNGYGTLAQAGWSEPSPLADAPAPGALTLATTDDAVVALSVPPGGGAATLIVGRYVDAASP